MALALHAFAWNGICRLHHLTFDAADAMRVAPTVTPSCVCVVLPSTAPPRNTLRWAGGTSACVCSAKTRGFPCVCVCGGGGAGALCGGRTLRSCACKSTVELTIVMELQHSCAQCAHRVQDMPYCWPLALLSCHLLLLLLLLLLLRCCCCARLASPQHYLIALAHAVPY